MFTGKPLYLIVLTRLLGVAVVAVGCHESFVAPPYVHAAPKKIPNYQLVAMFIVGSLNNKTGSMEVMF